MSDDTEEIKWVKARVVVEEILYVPEDWVVVDGEMGSRLVLPNGQNIRPWLALELLDLRTQQYHDLTWEEQEQLGMEIHETKVQDIQILGPVKEEEQ